MASAILGWGTFTWQKAERALTKANALQTSLDKVELKVAEHYLSKEEFNQQMDRLFDVLGEMKEGMQHLTERVDHHVTSQTEALKNLSKRRLL